MKVSNLLKMKENTNVEEKWRHSNAIPINYDEELSILEVWITKPKMDENCTTREDTVDEWGKLMKKLTKDV